jgi:hypothetical protein
MDQRHVNIGHFAFPVIPFSRFTGFPISGKRADLVALSY